MTGGKISLIVSTYNRPDALAKVFAGLRRQSVLPAEIIVADDGSNDATRRLVEEWKRRFDLPLRHVWHEDRGFRKTTILNRATAVASGEYVVLLDGDCVPHRRFIEDHAAVAERGFWVQGRRCFVKENWVSAFEAGKTDPLWWLLTGRLTGGFKAFRFPRRIERRNTARRGIIGCNMGFWRDDLLAVNGLDEEYTGWGIGEDSDLGVRLYHLGRPRKLIYGRAIVFHLNHPPLGREHLPVSLARFQFTLASGVARCARGLDQHLVPATPAIAVNGRSAGALPDAAPIRGRESVAGAWSVGGVAASIVAVASIF